MTKPKEKLVGRPPDNGESRKIVKSIRYNGREWKRVESLARKSGKDDSAFMRDRTLEDS